MHHISKILSAIFASCIIFASAGYSVLADENVQPDNDTDSFEFLDNFDGKFEKGQVVQFIAVDILTDQMAVDDDNASYITLGDYTFDFTFVDDNLTRQVLVYQGGNWIKLPEDSWYIKDKTVYVNVSGIQSSDDYGTRLLFAFVIQPKPVYGIIKSNPAFYPPDDSDSERKSSPVVDDSDYERKRTDAVSASTGYNTPAYIVCTIIFATGSAFFFTTSKKSAKEMG